MNLAPKTLKQFRAVTTVTCRVLRLTCSFPLFTKISFSSFVHVNLCIHGFRLKKYNESRKPAHLAASIASIYKRSFSGRVGKVNVGALYSRPGESGQSAWYSATRCSLPPCSCPSLSTFASPAGSVGNISSSPSKPYCPFLIARCLAMTPMLPRR